jgi:hypothetical protein
MARDTAFETLAEWISNACFRRVAAVAMAVAAGSTLTADSFPICVDDCLTVNSQSTSAAGEPTFRTVPLSYITGTSAAASGTSTASADGRMIGLTFGDLPSLEP